MSFWTNPNEKSVTDGEPSVNLAAATSLAQPSIPLAQSPLPAQTPAEPPEPAAKPKREQPAVPEAASDPLLGRGAKFEGKLTFQATVRIDATCIGAIVTNAVLLVGEAASTDDYVP